MDLRRLGTAALLIAAVLALVATTLAIPAFAGSTLGYDYQAYVGAARRALDGAPLYDPAISVAGGFAIFLYPPPFALVLVPFALLPDQFGLWLWEGLAMASFLAGVALLPVRAPVRWAVVLLGALDWPLLFALKLGQVGPLLFLLFAMGWRWRDRATPLRLSMATGVMIKVQPLLLLAWMGLTGRWRAVAMSAGRWWAIAIPLVTAWPLIGITPPVVYPVVFWVTMVATFVVGRTARAEGRTVLGEAVAA
jgi:Protein of unknown function (DUF2029).